MRPISRPIPADGTTTATLLARAIFAEGLPPARRDREELAEPPLP